MKKIIISALFAMGMLGAYAQTTDAPATATADVPLTKSGYKFLPEKGDYALGIDATPFLEYIGNAFNGTLNQDGPGFQGVNAFGDITIYGKYFLEANRAVRAKLLINTGTETYKETVRDDYAYYQQPGYNGQTVVDTRKVTGTNIGLIAGYEFRRGYRRLQGFYGGEVGVQYNTRGTNVYEYANPITADNTNPSTGFLANEIDPVTGFMVRTTEINPRNQLGVIVGGFVGVEYFILPKLSIGGEFNLQFSGYNQGQTEITRETWNADLGRVVETTTREMDGRASGFRLETLPQGSLFMMFYF
jgi:hypothetical protein